MLLSYRYIGYVICLCSFAFAGMLSSCDYRSDMSAERYNDLAYAYHYRNLDSTRYYAEQAYACADASSGQRAEALNNIAFVALARMDYGNARKVLDTIPLITENEIELFVSDIQQMRICQRCSENKSFYDWRERAEQRLLRIREDSANLSSHERKRMDYAESEYWIVLSTYYYYMGLERESVEALSHLSDKSFLRNDTAQYLAYLYNCGAGGVISEGSPERIAQDEFMLLTRCYQIASQHNYPYWKANALQSISEHLLSPALRDTLIVANTSALHLINGIEVADSLLAGHLASQALDIFAVYGDVYQMAGAYRTLASCYQQIGDYDHAFTLLHDAFDADTLILQAPDLTASIYEQLSIVCAALNDKRQSDEYRNLYLDLVGHTELDKAQEAMAEQLEKADKTRNVTIAVLGIMLFVGLSTILLLYWKRRSEFLDEEMTVEHKKWQEALEHEKQEHVDELMHLAEELESSVLLLDANQLKYMEQRAKVSIVNSITPLIDRILVAYQRSGCELPADQKEYVNDVTLKIEDYNVSLTQWIKMQRGSLNLHIESFPLQSLFDIIAQNKMSFALKGISLDIQPTTAVVKADPTLTLFMINTLADNARRFTSEGGRIDIEAHEEAEFVEVSISDDGVGMTPEQCAGLFKLSIPQETESRNLSCAKEQSSTVSVNKQKNELVKQSHYGFGLLNCSGIIEKYRKLSPVFNVCDIGCSSELDKGSRFHFRLPKGIKRALSTLLIILLPLICSARQHTTNPVTASQWADSVWYANINGNYHEAVIAAQHALHEINKDYRKRYKHSADTLLIDSPLSTIPPEVNWFHHQVNAPYDIILDVRNETAIAALALHDWQLYKYNNRVYTLLYKERVADNMLVDSIKSLQQNIKRKNSVILILSLLCAVIMLFMWFRYLLPRRQRKKCRLTFDNINRILNSDFSKDEQLKMIQKMNVSKLPANFATIYNDIVKELMSSITHHQKMMDDIELKRDQLNQIEYENQRLHVTNSVLDNCLSTLKHETMYFPSRIRQMISVDNEEQVSSVQEITQYYKTLHALLASQAQQQIQTTPLPSDRRLYNLLYEILHRINGQIGSTTPPKLSACVLSNDAKYTELTAEYSHSLNIAVELTKIFDFDQHHNQEFLICRQIVRDIGENNNLRGCGIRAVKKNDKHFCIIATLPSRLIEKAFKNNHITSKP